MGGRTADDVVEAAFLEMDGDGKGMVLLAEWCEYLKKAEIGDGVSTISTCLGNVLTVGDSEYAKAKKSTGNRLMEKTDMSLKGSTSRPDHVSNKVCLWANVGGLGLIWTAMQCVTT